MCTYRGGSLWAAARAASFSVLISTACDGVPMVDEVGDTDPRPITSTEVIIRFRCLQTMATVRRLVATTTTLTPTTHPSLDTVLCPLFAAPSTLWTASCTPARYAKCASSVGCSRVATQIFSPPGFSLVTWKVPSLTTDPWPVSNAFIAPAQFEVPMGSVTIASPSLTALPIMATELG